MIDNPGSESAGLKGCTCPVLDNSHGRGYLCQPNVFVIHEDCPLHTKRFNPTWHLVDGCGACLVHQGGDPANIADRVAVIEKTPRVRTSHRYDDFSQEHRNWTPGPKGPDAMDVESRAWCVETLKSFGWTPERGG